MHTTCFERAIFFSWGCSIGDCAFCYMSTQPKEKAVRETRRGVASLLAETLLCRELGWEIGFFTGGIGVFTPTEFVDLLEKITLVTKKKIWLSVGPLTPTQIDLYLPYVKGFVASVETVNPLLHHKVCPSKPLAPYERFLAALQQRDIPRAITIIVGIGEDASDIALTCDFITQYDISKVHLYGLIPTEGTGFSDWSAPSVAYQAQWIRTLREKFPALDIQCGIWKDRPKYVTDLLIAGANTISKFPAIRLFNSAAAQAIEDNARTAGRTFIGTLTALPDIDWQATVAALPFSFELQQEIYKKLQIYLKEMRRPVTSSLLVE